MRTRKGIASSRGRLKGKSPSSLLASRPSWSRMRAAGGYTIADLMEGFLRRPRQPSTGSRTAPPPAHLTPPPYPVSQLRRLDYLYSTRMDGAR